MVEVSQSGSKNVAKIVQKRGEDGGVEITETTIDDNGNTTIIIRDSDRSEAIVSQSGNQNKVTIKQTRR